MNRALYDSVNPNWQTPEKILRLVRMIAPIGLDPCTTPENPCGAEVFYHRGGLCLPWSIRAGVLGYVNPPYGYQIPSWVARCAVAGMGGTIIGLLPARVDTAWFHNHVVDTAKAIAFWRGRLRFRGAPYCAPFPSVLVCWGKDEKHLALFRGVFETHCWIAR